MAQRAFADEGLMPYRWSNQPGHRYPTHSHDYDKVLFCVDGAITFHTPDGDLELRPGQRMDLPAGTPHGATVGPAGVTCIEAAKN